MSLYVVAHIVMHVVHVAMCVCLYTVVLVVISAYEPKSSTSLYWIPFIESGKALICAQDAAPALSS